MAVEVCLLDTSVLTRLGHANPAVRSAVADRRKRATLARCDMTDLEFRFQAKNERQIDVLDGALAHFARCPVTAEHWQMAMSIQRDLAAQGLAGRKVPDLLIAAVAIGSHMTLLHYDNDFELIAQVSPLSHEWIVPRGTVD